MICPAHSTHTNAHEAYVTGAEYTRYSGSEMQCYGSASSIDSAVRYSYIGATGHGGERVFAATCYRGAAYDVVVEYAGGATCSLIQ